MIKSKINYIFNFALTLLLIFSLNCKNNSSEPIPLTKFIELISPKNGETIFIQDPTFSWLPFEGVKNYDIYISTDTAFSNIIYYESLNNLTSRTIPILLNLGVKYYWKVNGLSNNITIAYSQIQNFSTELIIPSKIIKLISPKNGDTVNTLRPTFSWSPFEGVNKYELYISTDKSFYNIIYYGALYTGTSKTIYYLLNHGLKYYWKVNGSFNNNSLVSSQINEFSTPASDFPELQLMNKFEVVINAFHSGKNDKDSMIITTEPFIFPIKKSPIHWLWEWEGIEYKGDLQTFYSNGADMNLTCSAKVNSNGKSLESFTFYEVTRLGSEISGGPINNYLAILSLGNLPYSWNDSSSYCFKITGKSSENYIKTLSYSYTKTVTSPLYSYSKWEYISSQWNDSSYIQVRFYK